MLRNFPVVAPQDVFVLPQSAETMHRCCSSILIAAAEANRFQCRENALYTTTARILQGQHLEEPMTVPCDSRLPSFVEPHGLIAASLRSIRQVQLRRAFHQVEVLNASLSRNKIVEADSLETSTTCGTKTKDAAKHFNTLAQCQQAVQSYQVLVSPPICHLQKQTMKDKSGEIRRVIDSSPSVSMTESDIMATVKDNVTNSRSANSSQKTLKMLGLTCLERRAAKIPYFDASVLEDPDCRQIKQYSRHHRDCAAIPFPEKLYRMLMEVAQEGKEDIISFFAHGRAFVMWVLFVVLCMCAPRYVPRNTSFQATVKYEIHPRSHNCRA